MQPAVELELVMGELDHRANVIELLMHLRFKTIETLIGGEHSLGDRVDFDSSRSATTSKCRRVSMAMFSASFFSSSSITGILPRQIVCLYYTPAEQMPELRLPSPRTREAEGFYAFSHHARVTSWRYANSFRSRGRMRSGAKSRPRGAERRSKSMMSVRRVPPSMAVMTC